MYDMLGLIGTIIVSLTGLYVFGTLCYVLWRQLQEMESKDV